MFCPRGPQGALETLCPFDLLPVAPVTVNGRPQCAYQASIRITGPHPHGIFWNLLLLQ